MIECEVKCQWVIAMQHTEYRLITVFSYNGDINSIIFNGVKLTLFWPPDFLDGYFPGLEWP